MKPEPQETPYGFLTRLQENTQSKKFVKRNELTFRIDSFTQTFESTERDHCASKMTAQSYSQPRRFFFFVEIRKRKGLKIPLDIFRSKTKDKNQEHPINKTTSSILM